MCNGTPSDCVGKQWKKGKSKDGVAGIQRKEHSTLQHFVADLICAADCQLLARWICGFPLMLMGFSQACASPLEDQPGLGEIQHDCFYILLSLATRQPSWNLSKGFESLCSFARGGLVQKHCICSVKIGGLAPSSAMSWFENCCRAFPGQPFREAKCIPAS